MNVARIRQLQAQRAHARLQLRRLLGERRAYWLRHLHRINIKLELIKCTGER